MSRLKVQSAEQPIDASNDDQDQDVNVHDERGSDIPTRRTRAKASPEPEVDLGMKTISPTVYASN